jgi:hypothetical protein
MIFLLNESVMNGTVTMKVISTGVEAPTFAEAVAKVKNLETFRSLLKVEIREDSSERFSYIILGQEGPFNVWASMDNKELQVVR